MFKQLPISSAMLMAMSQANQTLLDFESRQLQEVTYSPSFEKLWQALDGDEDGSVSVNEFVRATKIKDFGVTFWNWWGSPEGRVWEDIDSDVELDAS
jgi:Ca2+-binding EF-hand superfamily protein